MTSTSVPTLDAFLQAPPDAVAAVAPATMIYGPGGTRRWAAFHGYDPESAAYVEWSRRQMVDALTTIFGLGVRNVFITIIQSTQFNEVGVYREQMLSWCSDIICGPQGIADYCQHGWRARLVNIDHIPEWNESARRLVAETPADAPHTIWFYASTGTAPYWESLFARVHQAGARTQAEAIRAVYGEDIPPASLALCFGKLIVSPDIFPPLIVDTAQCYWTQVPGTVIDDITLRKIFYDYAYSRKTWIAHKRSRYDDVASQHALWMRNDIVGLGQRVGSFWYPLQSGIPGEE